MWDNHNGPKHFFGDLPIDTDSSPRIGEVARLTHQGFEFDVQITATENNELSGRITRIGPDPAIEAAGLKRGDVVQFKLSDIETLYRN